MNRIPILSLAVAHQESPAARGNKLKAISIVIVPTLVAGRVIKDIYSNVACELNRQIGRQIIDMQAVDSLFLKQA
jgi:hypothetical protein